MTNGREVAGRLRENTAGGIPWIAILSAAGDTLVTSDGPQGNIGYPYEPHEIEHFQEMLRKTAKHMGPDQIATVANLLDERARELGRK